MKEFFAVLCGLAIISMSGIAQRDRYCIYYDLSGDQDTAIIILNMEQYVAYFTIRVYDYTGKLLWSDMVSIMGYHSKMYHLSEKIARGRDKWGIVTLETDSDSILSVSALYTCKGKLISVRTVDEIPTAGGHRYYWYSAFVYKTEDDWVGFIISNPWFTSVSVRYYIYSADGSTLDSKTITLSPNASYFRSLGELPEFAGILDVRAGNPIVLAIEYYANYAKDLYTIDLITETYALTD